MENIHRFIEQTNLKPTLTAKEIDLLVSQAVEHRFFGICVPPFWVKKARREIGERDLQLITAIGFPFGYQRSEVKLKEIEEAINDGADELDVVMNISSFKTGMPWAKIELAKCSKLIHDRYKFMKVIIETAYLSSGEIEVACRMCADAGVDFVKTSTGFAGEGAKVSDVERMRKILPSNVGIKASGGINNYHQALELIKAGADRIGTSSGVEIVSKR